ncbi:hypothetical protein K438DRAFT_1453581, partial [Mycena galopus ATCC 62051]
WAPRVYVHYCAHDTALCNHLPHLCYPFEHSVFFGTTFNLGPKAWALQHHDMLNLSFRWC